MRENRRNRENSLENIIDVQTSRILKKGSFHNLAMFFIYCSSEFSATKRKQFAANLNYFFMIFSIKKVTENGKEEL